MQVETDRICGTDSQYEKTMGMIFEITSKENRST